jgi:hypothetical protein
LSFGFESLAALTVPVLSTLGHDAVLVVTGIETVRDAPPASVPIVQVTVWPLREHPAGSAPIASELAIVSVMTTSVASNVVVFVTVRFQVKPEPAATVPWLAVFSIATFGLGVDVVGLQPFSQMSSPDSPVEFVVVQFRPLCGIATPSSSTGGMMSSQSSPFEWMAGSNIPSGPSSCSAKWSTPG